MRPRRYRFDPTVERHGDVIVGGSPLRLFRLTVAGNRVADDITAGRPVASSKLVDALLVAGAIHPAAHDDSPFGLDDVTVVTPTLGPPRHHRSGAVVVDDGSQPPVSGATIRRPATGGPAAARNAGLDAVPTPLVAFVDADVATGPADDRTWLLPLLAHFADDRVVAVAPRVAGADGADALGRYEAEHSPLDLGPTPARVAPGTRVAYVPAAAIVCRTEVVRSIGGFDERLRFGEDVDLVWRLVRAGWIVRYEPAVIVRHDPRPGWLAWLRQRFEYGTSAAPLAARHGRAVAPVRTSGWSIATWAAALGVHPMAGLAIAGGTGAALVTRLPMLPTTVSLRLAGLGHWYAGRQFATAIRRGWWPLLVLAAIRSHRARVALALSVLAAGRPLRVVDDLAYSVGVWRGCWNERSLAALRPVVTSWPARRS